MKTLLISILVLLAFARAAQSQTVLEWLVSNSIPVPDEPGTLLGTLEVPVVGDGMTTNGASGKLLVGRYDPVTLANPGDSVSFDYRVLIAGGSLTIDDANASQADFRWGLFNSQGTDFTGNEIDFIGWTGVLAWNPGDATGDGDVRVRNLVNGDRFYVSSNTTDIGTDNDNGGGTFTTDDRIYSVSMTITRIAGNALAITTTLTDGAGYNFMISGEEAVNTEFTYDRVGFWLNVTRAKRFAVQTGPNPSVDFDSIPDLLELLYFQNLEVADDTTDFDGDTLLDADEINIHGSNPTLRDSDGDGLDDPDELIAGTNPANRDSDGDFYGDGDELLRETLPNDPASFPLPVSGGFAIDFSPEPRRGQIGSIHDADYFPYVRRHETEGSVDDPAGVTFPAYGSDVTLQVSYPDSPAGAMGAKQLIGRTDEETATYFGTNPDLVRDWIGIDARASEGGNGTAVPTTMALTITGLPSGDFVYRAYHHDVESIQAPFTIAITDADRTGAPLGTFTMTSGTNGDSPSPGGGPGELPSTVTAPFRSDGSPVVITYGVIEDPAEFRNSLAGVNGFEITLTEPFRITELEYDRASDRFSLEWTATAGQLYAVSYSTDLIVFLELNDNIIADGPRARFEDFGNPEPGSDRLFFRVEAR